MTPDAVVVGAGIVGCSIAYELAKANLRVIVIERGEIGREASWAAGGILTPVHLADYPTPLADLCLRAQRDYPRFIREIQGTSDEEVEYRVTGIRLLIRDDEDEKTARSLHDWKRAHGQPADRDSNGLFLPDIAQVRNHRLTRAIAHAAQKLGAEFRTGTELTGFLKTPGRVNGVQTSQGNIQTGTTILATGCWSGQDAARLGLSLPVRPVKGQMILVRAESGSLDHILLHKDQYLVPRSDGAILIGSTVEEAGFDKAVTLEGASFLLRRAAEIHPPARTATLEGCWAGLRPGTPDRLPYLGPAPSFDRLFVATGHFRNGILLGPITGVLVRNALLAKPDALLDAFRLDRSPAPSAIEG